MSPNPPPQPTGAPSQRDPVAIWAAVLGGVAAVVGIGYGAFLIAYAGSRENGTAFGQTVTSTPLLRQAVESMLVVLLVVIVLALVAVVMGIATIQRRRAVTAGWLAVILGVLAPWLTLIGVYRTLVVSFAWM